MNYKIPKSFECGGETIHIKHSDNLVQEDDFRGYAHYDKGVIGLQTNTPGFTHSDEQIYHTFIHEVVHFILHKQDKIDLRKDEHFVETTADLFVQMLKTAKY